MKNSEKKLFALNPQINRKLQWMMNFVNFLRDSENLQLLHIFQRFVQNKS